MEARAARPLAFPLLCALGYAGAVVGYLPLLSLLLPAQAERLAGAARFGVLAAALVGGAAAAAGANILFGWLSDDARRRRADGRRRWIAGGVLAVLAAFALLAQARTPAALVVSVILYQIALNAVLAPLLALIAEEVSDERKGVTAGLLAAAPALASLLALALATPTLPRFGVALAIVGVVTAACLVPLLVTSPRPPVAVERTGTRARSRRDLLAAWIARLLMQAAGNVLFVDLLYLMEEVAGARPPAAVVAGVGALLLLGNLAPLPLAIGLGRWSDRSGHRTRVLAAVAATAALGLAVMAAADGWTARALGFALFAVGWGVFLPLQIGLVMQLLPSAGHRGRDLGFMNLANTLPVLAGQGLAWWLAAPGQSAGLLYALAAAAAAAGGATLMMERTG